MAFATRLCFEVDLNGADKLSSSSRLETFEIHCFNFESSCPDFSNFCINFSDFCWISLNYKISIGISCFRKRCKLKNIYFSKFYGKVGVISWLITFQSYLKKLYSILRFRLAKMNCGFFHSWKKTTKKLLSPNFQCIK